jgi:hypothetical protein
MDKENNAKEPEEYLSAAKYLLELVQMDLNFSRKETIPARVMAIFENAYELTKIYPLRPNLNSNEEALNYFINDGYSNKEPTEVGLYSVRCSESNWESLYVAVTKNDFQMLMVHCPQSGLRSLAQYHANLDGTLWLRVA